MKTKHKTKIARLIKPRIKSDACITTVFKVSKKFELKLENNEFEKIHEKLLQMLGTNLIDWKKSATAKNRTQSFGLTQWFEKIGCDGSQNFEMHKKNLLEKSKNENREFGNLEIRKIRKRIRKIGNSETNSGNWKSGNEFGNWTDFEKMFGKSDLIAQACIA